MNENEKMQDEYIKPKSEIGRRAYSCYIANLNRDVYVKRKSDPSIVLVGKLVNIDRDSGKIYIESSRNSYVIDYDDLLTMDIKSKDFVSGKNAKYKE